MPTNRINVEYMPGEDVEVTVWDNLGNKHDISDIFQEVRDFTAKNRETAHLFLRSAPNSLSANIKFEATKKELSYEVTPAVIDQILEMKPR